MRGDKWVNVHIVGNSHTIRYFEDGVLTSEEKFEIREKKAELKSKIPFDYKKEKRRNHWDRK